MTTGTSATADTGAVGAGAAGGGVMDLAAGVPGGLGTTDPAEQQVCLAQVLLEQQECLGHLGLATELV